MNQLRTQLTRIDGRPYPAYKDLRGTYSFSKFDLEILHVQGDPFAAPSRLAIYVDTPSLGIDSNDLSGLRRTGLEDGIFRTWYEALYTAPRGRGSGKSGLWGSLAPGQEMLARSACEMNEKELVLRFTLGLPAAGRRIMGREASRLLVEDLPKIVESALRPSHVETWHQHALAAEDQNTLRASLSKNKWVAFIGNGSRLARASGVSDRPMKTENNVAWVSPAELEATIDLPNHGPITGTAIPEGVTLICGGGYHGKSTVLQALARGIYNHRPGDGREFCVSRSDTVAIRAEDGRSICSVNISPFISHLPNQKNTDRFSSENASGSTSQAANIMEAIEVGAQCLLIDEDTSATNFMIRDRRMQELVHKNNEPITPFIDRTRELFEKQRVSIILVIGGSGDYFEVADLVLVLKDYLPHVETHTAKKISESYPSLRQSEEKKDFLIPKGRVPLSNSFNPRKGKRNARVRTNSTRFISFGHEEIELSLLSQLVDDGQTRTLGDWLLRCAEGDANGQSLQEICETFEKEAAPLTKSTQNEHGDRVFVRRFELAAAINRLRSLQILGDKNSPP